ncbi:MAG: tol-pal system protein YbgF [Deltaproteobacteria bacterium]|nr:tol-pal system protein YbgF [Deltaproteobacteria bacterium]
MRNQYWKRFFAAAALSLSLYGCGPGFPIMTAEQEKLVNNVERLVRENEELKKRLSALETSGPAEIKKEIAGIRKSLAAANANMERLLQDFSSVRGGFEEGAHEKEVLKEELNVLKNSLKALDERFSGIEKTSKDGAAGLDSLKAALVESGQRLSAVEEAVKSAERKNSVEDAKAALDAKAASDPDAYYQKGLGQLKSKEYGRAIESFTGFLSVFPGHKLAGNAQYWLGEAYYAKGEFEKAIVEFEKVKKNFPKTDKVAAAMLKQGLSFENLGSIKEARVLFEQVVEKHPESPEAALAKKRLKAVKRP